jgi:hypothetical protein
MAAAKKKKPAKSKKPVAKKPAKKKTVAPKKQQKKAKPKAPPKPAGILPTAEEEARFWSLIEDAWATQSAETNAARLGLATRDPGHHGEDVEAALDGVEQALRAVFSNEDFPQEELVAMDRVLERKLYDIDRADIQAVTDGSDDGFLYARGFIVALGKVFYEAVLANPAIAICDAELEAMCYLPAQVHSERFGDYPKTGSGISRESCSNREGWADA